MGRTSIANVRRSENRADTARRRVTTKSASNDNDAPLATVSTEHLPSQAQSSLFTSNGDTTWTPKTATIFKLLISVRISAAIWSPISDCDETYNYWEPLHMWLYGEGFQTWEYSPVFAIRSYLYIILHYLPAAAFQLVLPHTKMTTFFFVRSLIAFLETISCLYLYTSVRTRLGNGVARYYISIAIVSSAMFVSASAFLPSTFAMICVNCLLGAWLDGQLVIGTLATGVGALLGWPFAAVLGLPIVAQYVVNRREVARFVLVALAVALMVGGTMLAVDSHYYGRRVLAPLNIVYVPTATPSTPYSMYNIFSPHGPELYGTAPLSFYLFNLAINWNLVAALAVVALPVTLFAVHQARGEEEVIMKKESSRSSLGDWSNVSVVVYIQATLALWLAIFMSQAHKEERFLFPAYPLIALSAALTLYSSERLLCVVCRGRRIAYILPVAVMAVFAALSLSRAVSQYKNYHAPFDTYMALNERVSERARMGTLPERVVVCVGKEWHRYPSSFFVPPSTNTSRIDMVFIKSAFDGLLPSHYERRLSLPNITRRVPLTQNDANREEMDRYVPIGQCDYLVDLDTGDGSELEPNYARDSTHWRIVRADNFLLTSRSSPGYRSFYVPFLTPANVLMGDYVLLERISRE